MQSHNLKRKTPNKGTRQVGRGGKRGKTSGRGTKGQLARAGHKVRPEIRDVIKRLPKLRGYAFKSIDWKPETVNLTKLDKAFKGGDVVSPVSLAKAGLVRQVGGLMPRVKILSDGEITKKLTIKDCSVSAKAKEKIEAAGGKILSGEIVSK
jgi:large subunit ribosomal protein L15